MFVISSIVLFLDLIHMILLRYCSPLTLAGTLHIYPDYLCYLLGEITVEHLSFACSADFVKLRLEKALC